MNRWSSLPLSIFVVLAIPFCACGASKQPSSGADHASLATRVFDREHETIQYLSTLRPVVETYIQATDHEGRPTGADVYFLGQWDVGAVLRSDLTHRVVPHVSLIAGQKERSIGSKFGDRYTFHPDDLTQMFFVDSAYFTSDYYSLSFEKEEMLGGVQCAVFDVAPLPAGALGRVEGKIWVEADSASIVRIHGRFTGEANRQDGNPEFDSWRWKAPSGFWIPNYLYSESTATNPADSLPLLRMRMTIELWGYGHDRQFAERSDSPHLHARKSDSVPGEAKVVHWLDQNALLAKHGTADEAVCAIARRLIEVSQVPQQRVNCRVLLTSPFESFAAGQTLVVSRGLLDLMPDEAALAAVISHDIAHILLGYSDPPAVNATGDIFQQGRVPRAMKFHSNPAHERAVRDLAVALLQKSPYGGTLDRLNEFVAAVRNNDGKLLRAPFGGQISAEIVSLATVICPVSRANAGALSLGSRMEVDPWDGEAWFGKTYRGVPSRTYPLGIAAKIPALQREIASSERLQPGRGSGVE